MFFCIETPFRDDCECVIVCSTLQAMFIVLTNQIKSKEIENAFVSFIILYFYIFIVCKNSGPSSSIIATVTSLIILATVVLPTLN